MENCYHGIASQCCSICIRAGGEPPRLRQPGRRDLLAPPHAESDNLGCGSIVIYPRKKDHPHPSFGLLDTKTTEVHVVGSPALWALELILKKAPNLKTIQVNQKVRELIKPAHEKLCADQGVKIVTGHRRPESVWPEGENRSPFFQKQRQFLLNLKGEQKELFDELLELGFEAALMTARYFCLKEEKFVSQRNLAPMFGITRPERANSVCIHVGAVLHYLDPSFETNEVSEKSTRGLKMQVAAIRRALSDQVERSEFLAWLKAGDYPKGLSREKLVTYFRLLGAQKDGRLNGLEKSDPRLHRALILSFGLDGSGKRKSAREVADLMESVNSSERAYELMRIALRTLGIKWV